MAYVLCLTRLAQCDNSPNKKKGVKNETDGARVSVAPAGEDVGFNETSGTGREFPT